MIIMGILRDWQGPAEQKRSGGSGVYYHFSYLGAPHDYLWLCTTPPVQMYMELEKAYSTGADKYWLVNVGDIKPAELSMQTFFEYAWDVSSFDIDTVNTHQSKYMAGVFGEKYQQDLQFILDTYYRLAWSRKPEYMGWEREWDGDHSLRNLSNTEFSFENYNDARGRLAEYELISDKVKEIYAELSPEYQPAFFEMLAYPVMASYQMNRKFLMAQLNNELVQDKDYSSANWAASQAKAAHDEIGHLNDKYNSILNGKWEGMMQVAPGMGCKISEYA